MNGIRKVKLHETLSTQQIQMKLGIFGKFNILAPNIN